MGSIRKKGSAWVAEVCINRQRKSKSFALKREAMDWVDSQEERGLIRSRTLKEAIDRYKPIAESHKGAQSELSRLNQLASSSLKDKPLDKLTPAMIAEYRDERLKEVAPVSVRRELIILYSLLKLAKDEWGWIRDIPKVKKPPTSTPRRRGISSEEVAIITEKLSLHAHRKQVLDLFLLSLETGMRLGEMCSLTIDDCGEKTVTLKATKNGDSREVPLSVKARGIIKRRKAIAGDRLFDVSPTTASKMFARCSVNDVHFHDARGEFVTRCANKGLNVLQVARIVGHRDLKSLMHYFSEPMESLADKL